MTNEQYQGIINQLEDTYTLINMQNQEIGEIYQEVQNINLKTEQIISGDIIRNEILEKNVTATTMITCALMFGLILAFIMRCFK